ILPAVCGAGVTFCAESGAESANTAGWFCRRGRAVSEGGRGRSRGMGSMYSAEAPGFGEQGPGLALQLWRHACRGARLPLGRMPNGFRLRCVPGAAAVETARATEQRSIFFGGFP